MVNKLRTFSIGAGAFLVLFALWGTLTYGPAGKFLEAGVIGVAIAAIPDAIAYGKLLLAHRSQRRRDTRGGRDAGVIYVSDQAVDDPDETLSEISTGLDEEEDYDPEEDTFSEGRGLTVRHTMFHNSFVRITDSNEVVVTGETTRTKPLARAVESIAQVTLERVRSNPMLRREPVRGAPRVFLSIGLAVMLVVGITTGVGGAYPSNAYNPAEKSVLVLMDARGALVPGISETETKLAKAGFLVDILEEESVEVLWAGNDSARIVAEARDAVNVSHDARALLDELEGGSLTPEQAATVEELRSNLRLAEEDMAATLEGRVAQGNVTDPERVEAIQSARQELLAAGNETG